MAKKYKMYLGGKWVDSTNKIEVRSPYNQKLVGVEEVKPIHEIIG